MRADQMPINSQRDACAECGMPCRAGEFHPYAACLMFKACGNSKTVKANLDALTHDKDWRIAELEAEVERLREGRCAVLDEAVSAINSCERIEPSPGIVRVRLHEAVGALICLKTKQEGE